jgi:hypothetical protein
VVKRACLLAVTLLLAGSGAAYSRSQSGPVRLVRTKGPIEAFAQDGRQLAWASINNHAHCVWQVWMRLLKNAKAKQVDKTGGPTCQSDTGFDPAHVTYLALAGKQALWNLWDSGNSTYQTLVSATYAGAHDFQLQQLVFSNGFGDGDHLGGIAGDSSTLVYGVTRVGISGPVDCDESGTCTAVVSGGGVERVTGSGTVAVPGAPPTLMLAAAGHRFAAVVAATASTDGTIGPGSPASVVVRDAVTGAAVGSFSPSGRPLALAFAPSVVAVLESGAGGRKIEFHSPAGALLRTVAVPAGATSLSTTNTRAVFRVGRSIRTVPVAAGSATTLATAAATPVGLSIEGTRVAWAENVTISGVLRGRILALTVH